MMIKNGLENSKGPRKKILLTNDDGISSPSLWFLFEAFRSIASVTVVAPDRERSGTGHAFTYNNPLHYEKQKAVTGKEAYIVSGTPVDCVKFAVSYLLKKRPDVIVAGLNIGENSGLSAFYSGTVAAAREGAFWDIPSFAFSVCEEGKRYAQGYAQMAPGIMQSLLSEKKRPSREGCVFYNINFPPCKPEKARGVRVTSQSMAFFDDRYERVDVASHHTKRGYVIYGEKKNIERSDHYDSRALMNNYITITPLCFDATARLAINPLPH